MKRYSDSFVKGEIQIINKTTVRPHLKSIRLATIREIYAHNSAMPLWTGRRWLAVRVCAHVCACVYMCVGVCVRACVSACMCVAEG